MAEETGQNEQDGSVNPLSVTCPRYILLSFNLIFLIFGCVLVGVGSVAYNTEVLGLSGVTLPAGIIVLGVFIMLMAFFGFYGAKKENRCYLGIYFAMLLAITIALLFVGIALYAERNNSRYYMTTGWNSASADLQKSLQDSFGCCGLTGANDSKVACPVDSTTRQNITRGCLDLIDDKFHWVLSNAGGVAIGFAVVMIFFLLFVVWMFRGLQKKQFNMDVAEIKKKLQRMGKIKKSKKGSKKPSKKASKKKKVESEEEEED